MIRLPEFFSFPTNYFAVNLILQQRHYEKQHFYFLIRLIDKLQWHGTKRLYSYKIIG